MPLVWSQENKSALTVTNHKEPGALVFIRSFHSL